MRMRIKVRDLRVTDRVWTIWGEGPIALTSVEHGSEDVRFKREDGWSESFFYKAWDDATMDFTKNATMTVYREDA